MTKKKRRCRPKRKDGNDQKNNNSHNKSTIIILDLKDSRRLFLHLNLNNSKDSHCTRPMLQSIVSESLPEHTKSLEPAIDCFVACSCLCFHSIKWSVSACWSGSSWSVSIDTITKIAFTWQQRLLQASRQSNNHMVRESTTRKRTIDPNNISCLDCNANLIPHTSVLELDGEPLGVERTLFVDHEVGSIHRDQTNRSIVVEESILPINL